MKKLAFILIISLVSLTVFSSDKFGPSDEDKINFVLNKIETSKVVFLRNGSEHSASDAADHLRRKMNNAKKKFWFFGPERKITYKEFVEKIATKSSMSGKKYKVKLPNGRIISVEQWIKNNTINAQ